MDLRQMPSMVQQHQQKMGQLQARRFTAAL
jgi:hypothetical protein